MVYMPPGEKNDLLSYLIEATYIFYINRFVNYKYFILYGVL